MGNNITINTSGRDDALEKLISQISNSMTKDYINNRVISQMKWYSRRSKECKRRYQVSMMVAIILGALIPVVAVIANGDLWIKVLLAMLGAAVTAVNACLSLFKFGELWIEYRNAREGLLRIIYYYFNNANVFEQEKLQEEKDKLLVNMCEEVIANESGVWITLHKAYLSNKK